MSALKINMHCSISVFLTFSAIILAVSAVSVLSVVGLKPSATASLFCSLKLSVSHVSDFWYNSIAYSVPLCMYSTLDKHFTKLSYGWSDGHGICCASVLGIVYIKPIVPVTTTAAIMPYNFTFIVIRAGCYHL